MSLAELKLRMRPGQIVEVNSDVYPRISELRIVGAVRPDRLGTRWYPEDRMHWVNWPEESLCRIEGDTVHWLDPRDPGVVMYSCTFKFKDGTGS